jgi:pyrroloquinoline quinone (PQQ) biosynthesis protein C
MPATTETPATEEDLFSALSPLQSKLAEHPLYGSIHSLEALHLFMQSHVYAVWDFMSLLKALQRTLTCVDVPWIPSADPASRRLINEIVLGEETDEYGGHALSHYELYLHAMQTAGAKVVPMQSLLAALSSGTPLDEALDSIPSEAASFVRTTFEIIATGQPHRIAAAFTLGREDLIPEMFTQFIRHLDNQLPGHIAPFRFYLERHVELDGDDHGPKALKMLRNLCLTPQHWAEAAETASVALQARIALWDGILARIRGSQAPA